MMLFVLYDNEDNRVIGYANQGGDYDKEVLIIGDSEIPPNFNKEYRDYVVNPSEKTLIHSPIVIEQEDVPTEETTPQEEQISDEEMHLHNIRTLRSSEFDLFDKYQLTLYWSELTPEQQTDYAKWRSDWLGATTTLIQPARPSWFVE